MLPGKPEHRDPAHPRAIASIEAVDFDLAPPARQPQLRHEKDRVIAVDDRFFDVRLERLAGGLRRFVLPHVDADRAKPGRKVPSERRIRVVVRVADENFHDVPEF